MDFDYSIAARKVAARSTKSLLNLVYLLSNSSLIVEYECGQVTRQQFFEQVRDAVGFQGDLAEFGGYFADIFTEIPQMIALHAEVRRRGFKVALVTACALKNMQHSLNGERQAHFDFIITGDEVPRAKPFPDPFLTAAHQLGLRPEECVVVENAPLGIESARNAGMRCVAIETTLGKEYLTSADHVLQNIAELLSLPILIRDSIRD